jgi:hypothetical protein
VYVGEGMTNWLTHDLHRLLLFWILMVGSLLITTLVIAVKRREPEE